jgi:NitT/TauT family transport system ATP-binding protein
MKVALRGITKRFGATVVMDGFSCEFPPERVVAVMGPSGCGKTTLLDIIAGLLEYEAGTVEGADRTSMGYLFQDSLLLPWKTARANIELVLENTVPDRAERTRRALALLERMDLGHAAERYPHQLSGGMKRRVSLARAFAYPASLLLMDEPFQALDLKLRLSFAALFNGLRLTDRRTTIFVTHDIPEALLLGDEILVMSGPPLAIRERIANPLPVHERALDREESIGCEKRLYALLA